MGKIVISTNSSLDGVVQDPDGKDGTAFGGWFDQAIGEDRTEWMQMFTAEALAASALLLGRTSDEWFASRWLGRTGEWADKLNGMPKYVVSRSLKQAAWSNATLLDSGDPIGEVARVREEVDGEILVYGSFQLGHALMAHGLVDEVRVMVVPVLVGEGVRLFGEGGGGGGEGWRGGVSGVSGGVKPLRLLSARTLGNGVLFYDYEVVHGA